MVATISRFLRQETARPKTREDEQHGAGRPGGDGVKAQGGFPQQGRENQHGGQAMQRGFHAARGGSARGPDQPCSMA